MTALSSIDRDVILVPLALVRGGDTGAKSVPNRLRAATASL
jgi:hypothetical protein